MSSVQQQDHSPQPVLKIGLLTGLTGSYGPWGQAGLIAATIAVKEINQHGGVNGALLDLIVADNKSSVEGSVAGWKRLVEVEDVKAISGIESGGAIALLDESSAARVPIICPACGTPKLAYLGGDYVFRLTGGDDDLGIMLAQVILQKSTRVAVITQQGLEATEGISKVFINAFRKGGGNVVSNVKISSHVTSFRTDLEIAFRSSEHVLFSVDLEMGMRLLMDYIRRDYSGTAYLIPDAIANDIAVLSQGSLENRVFGVTPTYDLQNPSYVSFSKAYKDRTGNSTSPALYEANSYDQIILLALAAVAAGSNNSGEAIRNHLIEIANPPGVVVYSYSQGVEALKKGQNIAYYGASGSIDFNKYGNVTSMYSVVTPKTDIWAELSTIELNLDLRPNE